MTAGDLSPDFRARVMEQVVIAPPARRLALFAWTAAAATVVVAAIALSVGRPLPSAGVERAVVSGSPAAPAAATADAATPVEPGARVAAVRRASPPQPPATLVAWRLRNIPALEGVAALEVEPIQPAGLSISQLSVTPLDVAPIVVPSIPPVEGGR
jgi:hypothetical protein